MCPNCAWSDTRAALTVEVTIFLTITRRIKTYYDVLRRKQALIRHSGSGYALGHCCYITSIYALRKTEVGLQLMLCHSSTINSPSTDTRDGVVFSLENLVCVMW